MSLKRVRLNNLSTQKVTGRSLRLSRLSRKRFPFPSGGAAIIANYIEDVFSTYLYNGSGGSGQTIVNGIDLSTKGGLVWGKVRTNIDNHYLFDTARGVQQGLNSNTTDLQGDSGVNAFNVNGFSVDTNLDSTNSARTFVTWTFRKQPKFFDVVTWTGDGTFPRNITHNLGSSPGCVIIKKTSVSPDNWYVWHRSLTAGNRLQLDSTPGQSSSGGYITGVTSTTINAVYNDNGANYVAYIFAHDAGGFGATGTDNVISCGSFTTDGSANATVTLGYEPQWLLVRRSSSTGGNWFMLDVMRGWSNNASLADNVLFSNAAGAEDSGSYAWGTPTATGFSVGADQINSTYIYIAIRRGPMKTPTSGTGVFAPVTRAGTGANATYNGGVLSDLATIKATDNSTSWVWAARLMGASYLSSNSTAQQVSSTGTDLQSNPWDVMDGIKVGTSAPTNRGPNQDNYVFHLFRRAPGFFDIVCYSGDSTFGRQVTHNLGVTPEMFIVKARNAVQDWVVYHKDAGETNKILLNTTAAKVASTMFNNTAPSATAFVVGANGNLGEVNFSSYNYTAYLFATLPGVSKVGSYTGTGTTLQVDCGFTSGARFVMIKRTDSTGDWQVWDTARGIVTGNDSYLRFNLASGQVSGFDYIDPYSPGFEISSTAPAEINANGGTYIFLAIA